MSEGKCTKYGNCSFIQLDHPISERQLNPFCDCLILSEVAVRRGCIEHYRKFPLENSRTQRRTLLKTPDFVTFTEEILNGKLNFLCSVN